MGYRTKLSSFFKIQWILSGLRHWGLLSLQNKFLFYFCCRALSSLLATSNPPLALSYFEKAEVLGGESSGRQHGRILDLNVPTNLNGKKFSRKRMEAIANVISKLDPVFSYHSMKNQVVNGSQFVSYLSGTTSFGCFMMLHLVFQEIGQDFLQII